MKIKQKGEKSSFFTHGRTFFYVSIGLMSELCDSESRKVCVFLEKEKSYGKADGDYVLEMYLFGYDLGQGGLGVSCNFLRNLYGSK